MENSEKSKQKKWTAEYIDTLTELSYKYSDKLIAKLMSDKFGVEFTMVSVRRKRNKLGLKKFGGKKMGVKAHKNETPKQEGAPNVEF